MISRFTTSFIDQPGRRASLSVTAWSLLVHEGYISTSRHLPSVTWLENHRVFSAVQRRVHRTTTPVAAVIRVAQHVKK